MDHSWERLENESEEEYIYRICDNKELIGSWESVGKILNENLGYEYTESKYRKAYQSYQKLFDTVGKKLIKEDKLVQTIQEQKDALQKERYKLQATKLEKLRYDRQDARIELFMENFNRALEKLPVPNFEEVEEPEENDKAWVLGMGDIHFGANFTSQNNKYSREECRRRLSMVLGFIKSEIEKNNIKTLKVLNVADTIQGILRLSDLQLNEVPVVDAVVEVARTIAAFLNQLSAYCYVEYYHCPAANHTQIRPLGSKANELVAEDLERVIVSYITDVLANNKRIHVFTNLDKDYVTFNIFGFKAILLHGHQIRSPKDTIKDLSTLHRVWYDYAFLGHRHSANEVIVAEGEHHNIEVLTCPSLIGSDPYSDSLMTGSKAMVKLYEFDKVYGHIGSKSFILN